MLDQESVTELTSLSAGHGSVSHTVGMPVMLLVGEAARAAEERPQRGLGCGADADRVHLVRPGVFALAA